MPVVASSSSGGAGSSLNRAPKTLTPQRKHRKMLKDGSSEVWPESIEKIFVEGLRQYWDSPWATFSRGRSRWRNQFLVDYLHKRGIERSKKQVASHIQVLRNMWKGEPEYQLVAGGDELFPGTNMLTSVSDQHNNSSELRLSGVAVKREHGGQSPLLFPRSPSSSGSDSVYDSGIAPELYSPVGTAPPSVAFADTAVTTVGFPADVSFGVTTADNVKREGLEGAPCNFARAYVEPAVSQLPDDRAAGSMSTLTFAAPLGTENLSAASPHFLSPTPSDPASIPSSYQTGIPVLGEAVHNGRQSLRNRLTALCLWSQRMERRTVRVDEYIPLPQRGSSCPGPIVILIRLQLPVFYDGLYSALAFDGFQGAIQMESPWTSGQCATRVYQEGVCHHQDTASLKPPQSLDETQRMRSILPESWLTRSRWLDIARRMNVSQTVVVDGVTLAVINYEFSGIYSDDKPSAEVLEVRRPTLGKPWPPQYPSGNNPPTSAGYEMLPRQPAIDSFSNSSYSSLVGRQRSGTASSVTSAGSQPF